MNISKTLKSLVLLFGLLISSASFAANVEIEVDENNVILAGHDAVAYFTNNAAIVGSASISTVYNSAIYRFSSEANRDTFKANPAKYAPQYGGFCAYGASVAKKFEIDGKAFEVVDGKLFVTKNLDVQKLWSPEKATRIPTANTNWKKIENLAPDTL